MLHSIVENYRLHEVMCVLDSNEIVAAISYSHYKDTDPKTFRSNETHVHGLASTRKGCGTALLEHVEQESLSLGLSRVTLIATAMSRQFYLKRGYTSLEMSHFRMYKDLI